MIKRKMRNIFVHQLVQTVVREGSDKHIVKVMQLLLAPKMFRFDGDDINAMD